MKNIYKIQFISFALLFLALRGISYAQNRTELGGNFAIQFGHLTLIELSPRIGYWFTNYLVGGIGGRLIWMDDKRQGGYTGSIYGMNLYSRIYPAHNYYLHGEFVRISNAIPAGGGVVYRIWSDGLLLGVGYVQRLSENSAMNLSLLWDVLGQKNFPYSNPIINAGVITRF